MEEAVATLKKFVQENVFPDIGMANEYMGGHEISKEKVDPMQARAEAFIKDIEACTKITDINSRGVETGLLSYESPAKSDPRIQAAYDLQMIKLKKQP